MGLSLETFLDLTPQQFEGAYERYIEKIETDDILLERVARKAVFKLLTPPEKKGVSLYDWWPIKGDRKARQEIKKKQKPSTRNRFEELNKKWL